jgi:prepilin-type N-terminal cleavage/methylation domain-containing protein
MKLQTGLRSRRRKAGFTLVEIMIVIMIIGLLLNIATPAFINARDVGQARACVSTLHNIVLAKEQYAIENNAPGTITPIWSNLTPYMKSNATPVCPTNGSVYSINDLNTYPTCSYGGPIGLPHVSN